VTQLQEAILWAALCFNPNGFEVYDPIAATRYEVKSHYYNQLWCCITWGLDVKARGPGEEFDWVVVKYKIDPFNARRKFPREVTHHNEYGVAVEDDQ
jgi:hypothetical protein